MSLSRTQGVPGVAICGLREKFAVSERRACEVLDQPRSCQRYEAQPRNDERALVTGFADGHCEFIQQEERFKQLLNSHGEQ